MMTPRTAAQIAELKAMDGTVCRVTVLDQEPDADGITEAVGVTRMTAFCDVPWGHEGLPTRGEVYGYDGDDWRGAA